LVTGILPLADAGVVGGGAMGVGIAYVFAAGGIRTYVVEPDPSRSAEARETIAAAAADGASRGKFDETEAAGIGERVHLLEAVDALPTGLPLVVESVPERLDVKLAVLAAIDGRTPEVIATNTSSLSIDRLSSAVRDPARFLGMHFFNPVWSLPLVELVCGSATGSQTHEFAESVVASIGKQAITVRDSPGFATSRLDLIASLEAMRMVQDGVASATDIDKAAVLAYRHPIGPLRLSDLVGLDVRLDIARHLAATLGERFRPPRVLEDLVAAGHLGAKSGQGFFEWPR
jgi:3-hydroxybutyryl-CoA dehydrogenase